MDLFNEDNLLRYQNARRSSESRLDNFRRMRKGLIERFVGSEYASNSFNANLYSRTVDQPKTIVPKMMQMVSTFTYMLASTRPQVDITTTYTDCKPFAVKYKIALNNLLKEIAAEKAFRLIIQDAIFCIGIGKVCFVDGAKFDVPNPDFPPEPSQGAPQEHWDRYAQAQAEKMPRNVLMDAGKPFFEHVSLDDFNFDMSASCWEQIRWMSHDYRVPFDEVKNDPRYDKKTRDSLYPDSKWHSPNTPPARMLQTGGADVDELEDMITLSDVYLPHCKMWYVMSRKNTTAKPLYGDMWRGETDYGPFIPLSFYDVVDSVMPASLAAALAPLHDCINALKYKSTTQALDQKTVYTYTGNEQDAINVRDGSDQEIVRVNNDKGMGTMATTGANQQTVAYTQMLEVDMSKGAGNFDAIAGLGPQSGTVGQDKLIKDSTNVMMGLTRNRVYEFTSKVCESLGWMLWVDQVKTIPGQAMLPGISRPVPMTWTPQEREGDFWQYNFTVDPYSMEYKAPSDKLSDMMGLITNIALPAAMIMGQGGVTVNWQTFFEYCAELMDNPRVRDLFSFGGQPIQFQGQPTGGTMPSGGDGGEPSRYIKQTQSSPGQQQADLAQNLIRGMGQQQPQGTL